MRILRAPEQVALTGRCGDILVFTTPGGAYVSGANTRRAGGHVRARFQRIKHNEGACSGHEEEQTREGGRSD